MCHYGEKKTSQAVNFELTKVILNKLNMEMTECRSIPECVIPVNPKFDYFDSNLVICALEHIPTFVCLSPMATIPITNSDVPVMTLINIHLHSKPLFVRVIFLFLRVLFEFGLQPFDVH